MSLPGAIDALPRLGRLPYLANSFSQRRRGLFAHEDACLAHLTDMIRVLRPEFLVGVGGFAEVRLARAAEVAGSKAKVGRILHPSPASPAANRGWAAAATRQLVELGAWDG